jgi:hypothetical protein
MKNIRLSLVLICLWPLSALAQTKIYRVNYLKTVTDGVPDERNISYREEIIIDELNKKISVLQYSNSIPDIYYKIFSTTKSKSDKGKVSFNCYRLMDDDSKIYYTVHVDTFFHKIRFVGNEQWYMIYGYK